MASFVIDSFTTASNVALESHTGETGATWTSHTSYSAGSFTDSASASSRVQNTSSSNGQKTLYYASGVPASADYEVSVDVVFQTNATELGGPCARINTAANTYYEAEYTIDNFFKTLAINKWVAGTKTQLSSASVAAGGASHTIKLRCVGSTLTAYADGVSTTTTADSSITAAGKAGLAGVYGSGVGGPATQPLFDNFLAADVAGATAASDPAFRRARNRGLIMRRRGR